MGQYDTSGIYIRFADDPSITIETNTYKNIIDSIADLTGGNYDIGSPFIGARRSSLTRMRHITMQNAELYLEAIGILERSGLFETVFVMDEEPIVNGGTDNLRAAELMPDPPECNSPVLPNDPGLFAGNYMHNMQVPCAWSFTTGDPSVTVGVVDWYIDRQNVELQGKVLNTPQHTPVVNVAGQYGPAGNSPIQINARTTQRHGTAMMVGVAGIADNNICVAGTGGHTTLRGYTPNPRNHSGFLSSIIQAAVDGNPVISISVHYASFWGSFNPNSPTARMIRDVFEEAVDLGSFVTFAVRSNNAQYLQDIDGVMLVGFGWENGAYQPYHDANQSTSSTFDDPPDSPFEMVLPTSDAQRMEGPALCSAGVGGSSLGAAFLAGIAALMLDVNNCLTPEDIEDILYESSDDVPNRICCHPSRFEPGKGKVNAYQAVPAAQGYTGRPRLEVLSGDDQIIAGEHLYFNDIIVRTGATLQINNSTINIEGNNSGPYQSGRIVVERGAKLIVRNSLLTSSTTNSLCSSSSSGWSGIRVHGNIDLPQPNMYDATGTLQVNTPLQPNEAGVVILLEGTVLEKAYNAVSTSAPGYPYQEQVNRWGGLVIANNVTFRNNFRAAEFLQYPRRNAGTTFTNRSTFKNCDFVTEDEADDRTLGITLWDTDGVTITQSSFQNLGRESILTIDGSFVVENGNRFSNDFERMNHRHLSTLKTYPYDETSRIGSEESSLLPNLFFSRDADDAFIHSADIDPADPLVIINNEFAYEGNLGSRADAPAGIELVGPQRFRILDNIFDDCERPVVLDNTGADAPAGGNVISCNTFNNSTGPVRLENDNEGTQLAQNTFSGAPVFGQISSNLRWNGRTDFRQGNAENPANNVFATTGAQRDITAFTSTNNFQYWYTDDGSGAANFFEPRGMTIGYENRLTTADGQNICGQGIPPGIQGPNTPGKIEELRKVLADLEQQLSLNPSDTSALIARQVTKLELDQRVNQFVQFEVSRGQVDGAVSVLNTLQTAAAEMRAYGIYVGAGRYADAAAKLPAINAYGPEYEEFVYVQNVNLDRLTDTLPYKLTPKAKADLTQYAEGDGRFRGYSRALLTLLEDERYYDDWDSSTANGKVDNANAAESNDGSSPDNAESLTVFPQSLEGHSTGTWKATGRPHFHRSTQYYRKITVHLSRPCPRANRPGTGRSTRGVLPSIPWDRSSRFSENYYQVSFTSLSRAVSFGSAVSYIMQSVCASNAQS